MAADIGSAHVPRKLERSLLEAVRLTAGRLHRAGRATGPEAEAALRAAIRHLQRLEVQLRSHRARRGLGELRGSLLTTAHGLQADMRAVQAALRS